MLAGIILQEKILNQKKVGKGAVMDSIPMISRLFLQAIRMPKRG